MPQLDFTTFFLQFWTISFLMLFLLWSFVLSVLSVIYLVLKARKIIFSFFNDYSKHLIKCVNLIFLVRLNLYKQLNLFLFSFFMISKKTFFKYLNIKKFKIISFFFKNNIIFLGLTKILIL